MTAESKTKKTGRKSASVSHKIKNKQFPVIGLGGSAGSFAAFEKFFINMPADTGMCFVIIMHLDPNHNGNIAELIQNFTAMPVIQAQDGLPVQPDHVYVIPPNKDMGIHNRKLLLLRPATPKGYRLPIDYFFQSLAEDQWDKAVGIIFSGMGSDGETGLRMIKEKLGMAMVQDPETAQYDSMPKAAIDTNLVDYVVAPEEMPVKLIQYLTHPLLDHDLSEQAVSETKDANAIQKVLMLLRSHTGHDFSLYKKSTITRRIDRRVAFHQLPDYVSYVNYLRENPHETDILFHELLIGVTKFFRDTAAFEALQTKFLNVLRNKADNEPIRIWIAGCSTGEEAYSIAILVMEYLETSGAKKAHSVQIFATDLDMNAIDFARAGLYHENIVADVSEERIEKYFVKKNDMYSVKKEVREMIIFAQHNIIKDAPFTRLDLLCCRNVMIYLTTELQKKIIPIFYYSLNPGAIYFMGPAETLGGFTEMFIPLDSRWKLYERKEGTSMVSKMIDFPFNVSKQASQMLKPDTERVQRKKTIANSFNQLLIDKYTPPSVLISEKGDIIYINGKIKKYLELTSGEAVMNIHSMARDELKYVIGNAIHQARSQQGAAIIKGIKLKEESGIQTIDLVVNYLENDALQGLLTVIFEEKGILKAKAKSLSKSGVNLAVDEIEKELIYTKQQLHTTIEQMETSLEELKSTNEELQSTNEELQSTNEESLTTKEEMQSLNEELMTINVQYQAKAEELTQLNNDMKNMLDNTEIGTIFLDNNLDILRFTPQIKKLFNVIASDVGRSIMHIVSNFVHPNIEEDLREVIEKLVVKEIEVETRSGEWYNLRIMPYRTTDNFINGAVLTINKITSFKVLEKQLKTYRSSLKVVLNSIEGMVLLLDENLDIISANKSFLSFFAVKHEEVAGHSFHVFVHESWKTNKLDKQIKEFQQASFQFNFKYQFPVIGLKKLKISSSLLTDELTKETLYILRFAEIAELQNE